MKTIYYEERCCEGSDSCFDIAHTHFDCPECEEKFAPTSIYTSLNNFMVLEKSDYRCDNSFSCQSCGCWFKLVGFTDSEMLIEREER